MYNFAVHLKLIQHCKYILFQYKVKKKIKPKKEKAKPKLF